jgi:hypothetical protein
MTSARDLSREGSRPEVRVCPPFRRIARSGRSALSPPRLADQNQRHSPRNLTGNRRCVEVIVMLLDGFTGKFISTAFDPVSICSNEHKTTCGVSGREYRAG